MNAHVSSETFLLHSPTLSRVISKTLKTQISFRGMVQQLY